MLDKSGLRSAYRAASLVTELVIATVIGFFVGARLDGWLDTAPWLLFLCTAVGFAAGNVRLFQEIQRLQQTDDDSDDHPS